MQKKLFIQIFLPIVVVLAACRVGRNYERPALALPEHFNSPATAPSDSSIAGVEWRQFFQDPTLVALIDSTLKGNYDLQLALKRIESAQEYVKQAKVAWLPSLGLQATANTTSPSKNSLNGISLSTFLGASHIEDYTLAANLSWEIDVWGKIKRQKEAALASYLQSYEGARAVQTEIVANVANSYYNLLMLDEQLQIAKYNVALSDSIVQMIQLQKAAGDVTQLAVQQAIAQQQTAALLVPQLEQGIAIQENALKILAGQLPDTVTRSTTLEEIRMWDHLSTGVPAELISKRPDVRSAEMELVAANAQVGVAQASMYPSLTITGTGGLNSYKFSNWFDINSLFGTVAGGLTQPVFQRRQLKTQLEVAKIAREEAAIRFRQQALNAIGEVSNALVTLDKLQTRRQIATDQVETLQVAIQQARMLFRSGLANYLEVITAQSNALQAQLTRADVVRQQLSASVELYRSLGGGWK
ncbi:efflux transporter outer membrane subunit [Chitinophaga japonensis]|uniref:NodT family efflux transporter outer membrane factor (OMF) lipoprotein n=1 Tax=Chitinophaga japonensis TaxID=104662 RepID=A0A562SUA4_CHIJA|nr:efflux transporter outer membrane subunit [Chitinophaga japonensis]TWI84260.1 NodT family efflux transporter outer membrane factor (OMF) lipoprotein [Chitinophaga japonensis]